MRHLSWGFAIVVVLLGVESREDRRLAVDREPRGVKVAMLTGDNRATAERIGAVPEVVVAAQAVGGAAVLPWSRGVERSAAARRMKPQARKAISAGSKARSRRGSQSDTQIPLWPCCFHLRGQARSGEPISPIDVMTLPKLSGSGLPASLFKSGFGSNRSMCDGPPSMNRKIQLFAVARFCATFAASGLDTGAAEAAERPSRAFSATESWRAGITYA